MPAKKSAGKPDSASSASSAIRTRAKKLAEQLGVRYSEGDTLTVIRQRGDKQNANKGAKAAPTGKHTNPAPSGARHATIINQQKQQVQLIQAPVEQAEPTAQREFDSLILTDYMRSSVGLECDRIDFLRGKALGQPLGPDNVYAIRCNEQYVDGEAAIEGERTHARAAMLKAGSIHLFFPHGKRPIIILSKFEQSNIKSATERATDAAKKRIRCMKRSASTKLEVKKRDIPGQLRIIGKNADLEEIARKVPAESFWAVRSHHIDGLSTAHVYLTDEVAKQVLDSSTSPSNASRTS